MRQWTSALAALVGVVLFWPVHVRGDDELPPNPYIDDERSERSPSIERSTSEGSERPRGPQTAHERSTPDADSNRAGGRGDLGTIVRKSKRMLARFRRCYERELKNNPRLAGRINVRFTIHRQGRVANALATAQDPAMRSVARCVTHIIAAARYPSDAVERSVTLAYPIAFAPRR